jgi:hypothetical protein
MIAWQTFWAILALALAGWLLWVVIKALRHGEIWEHPDCGPSIRIERATTPVRYWLTVAFAAGLTAFMTWSGLRVLVGG